MAWITRVAATTALLVLASCTTVTSAPSQTPDVSPTPPVAGAPGAGDPYFPTDGNGGIDVTHYALRLSYAPPTSAKLVGRLKGTATLTLTPTQPLRSFHLDLVRSMRVSSVRVDGTAAAFAHHNRELIITPASALAAGTASTIEIRYAGKTGRPRDANGDLQGWITTRDGAIVASEPNGSPTWYPVNDHPSDKATYEVSLTVPRGRVGVSNGDLVATKHTRRTSTYVWRMDQPAVSYAVTACVGNYRLVRSRTAKGLPLISAIDKNLSREGRAHAERALRLLPEMIDFFEQRYGPYPFSSAGIIVDDDRLGIALETQTRPIFPGDIDELTSAHELAHMWFGDSVSISRWRDIWLNEGLTTWAEWEWTAHTRSPLRTPISQNVVWATDVPARETSYWNLVLADPGPRHLFDDAVYERGAVVLYELRREIGAAAFAELMRQHATRHAHGNATVEDFTALAEQVSGRDLDAFFTTWLYGPGTPPR